MTVGAEGLNEGTHDSIEDDCGEGVWSPWYTPICNSISGVDQLVVVISLLRFV